MNKKLSDLMISRFLFTQNLFYCAIFISVIQKREYHTNKIVIFLQKMIIFCNTLPLRYVKITKSI